MSDADTDFRSMGDAPTLRFGAGQPNSGEVLLGRYRITGELGRGGMGAVYRCYDEISGIDVALKTLPPELSHDADEMEQIRDNFRLVEKLHHPSIAAAKTLERDPASGDYFLVMECVDGVTLRRHFRRNSRQLSLDSVVPLVRQVAQALDYAHSMRIVHRDIKPSNIMIQAGERVKVLDFGLAAQIKTSLSRVSVVGQGTSGTAPYMSPEQWRGRQQAGAADQYSLAVMTYELLAGHMPFDGHDPSVLREAVLNEAPECIDGISANAWHALAIALSKTPAARHESCADFARMLSRPDAHAVTPPPIPASVRTNTPVRAQIKSEAHQPPPLPVPPDNVWGENGRLLRDGIVRTVHAVGAWSNGLFARRQSNSFVRTDRRNCGTHAYAAPNGGVQVSPSANSRGPAPDADSLRRGAPRHTTSPAAVPMAKLPAWRSWRKKGRFGRRLRRVLGVSPAVVSACVGINAASYRDEDLVIFAWAFASVWCLGWFLCVAHLDQLRRSEFKLECLRRCVSAGDFIQGEKWFKKIVRSQTRDKDDALVFAHDIAEKARAAGDLKRARRILRRAARRWRSEHAKQALRALK